MKELPAPPEEFAEAWSWGSHGYTQEQAGSLIRRHLAVSYIRDSLKDACLEEVRNEAREVYWADFENHLLCYTRTPKGSQETYKATKCANKKGAREEKPFKKERI